MPNNKFREFFLSWDPQNIEIWEEDNFYLGQYPPALIPDELRGFYTVKIEKANLNGQEARKIIGEKLYAVLKSRAKILSGGN